MYAVIQDRGRQFRVSKGDKIFVDLLDGKTAGEAIRFQEVLLLGDEAGVKVGSPTVAEAEVVGRVEGLYKADKLVIYKYRRRKGYHKKKGHRQKYTQVRIEEIKG